MKNFLFLFALLAPTVLFSQNYWTAHDINIDVIDMHIESPQKVWLSTNNGLCVFNTLTSQYDSCYNSTNSNLIGTPSQLIYANNRIWVKTSTGISSFNGSTFNNYTTANGLISDSITDMAVDTGGQLWLASLRGVSHFNGTNFIHDSAIVGLQIAIDDSNRVFVVKKHGIANIANALLGIVDVKVDTVWQQHFVSGIPPFLTGGPVIGSANIKSVNGKVVILNSYDGGYYELSYPARIDSVKLNWDEMNSISATMFKITDITEDINGRKWLTSYGTSQHIFSGINGSVHPHYFYGVDGFPRNKIIKVEGNLVVAVLDQKLFTASILVEPSENETEEIDVNSIKTNANVIGTLFNNYSQSIADFEMPKGSNSHSIYNANFMISSKRNGDTSYRMNQLHRFLQSFKMGPVNNSDGVGGTWIVNITKQDIQNHISNYTQTGYILPKNIVNWRGNGDVSIGMANQLADFIDINQNQIYEPMLGDYPAIKGDEAVYWINHTQKLEYHGMLYGYDNPSDTALNQSLFIDYKIINRDNVGYDSIKMGMYVDFDLGNYADDYIGCDSLENIYYTYNGDSFDENNNGVTGYGSNIPVVGIKFLSDSMDGFVYYNIGVGTNGNPNTDKSWHNYLNSKWQDGTPILYGGNGLNSQGTASIPTKYMYAGGNWTEDNPGVGASRNPAGARRGLAHIPYFGLQPGQSKTVSVAIGYGTKVNGGRLGGLPKLLEVLDSAKNYWSSAGITLSVLEQKSNVVNSSLSIYPNPTSGSFMIQINNNQLANIKSPLQVYSSDGVLIKTVDQVFSGTIINMENEKSGVYFVKLGSEVRRLLLIK